MIDIIKHLEKFNPNNLKNDTIHIIGLGAIGSNLAVTLTRLGLTDLKLYDFDTVNSHNIANQYYFEKQIGMEKTEALKETLLNINSDANPILYKQGWLPNHKLSGYVFLCVDDIELRRQIILSCKDNFYLKGIFDFRMRYSDAQHYAALKTPDNKQINTLLAYTNFTNEEAKQATPISACGTTLSILPTINEIISLGVANFINSIIEPELFKNVILCDTFHQFINLP